MTEEPEKTYRLINFGGSLEKDGGARFTYEESVKLNKLFIDWVEEHGLLCNGSWGVSDDYRHVGDE